MERDEEIEIGLPDGRSVSAELVGRDPGSDLACCALPSPRLRRCRARPSSRGSVISPWRLPGQDRAVSWPHSAWSARSAARCASEAAPHSIATSTDVAMALSRPAIDWWIARSHRIELASLNASVDSGGHKRDAPATLLQHGRVRCGYQVGAAGNDYRRRWSAPSTMVRNCSSSAGGRRSGRQVGLMLASSRPTEPRTAVEQFRSNRGSRWQEHPDPHRPRRRTT